MSRSNVVKTLFSDFKSHSFSRRNSKTRGDLWATYACAKKKTVLGNRRKRRKGGGAIFKLRYGWKKSAWIRKHFLGAISETGLWEMQGHPLARFFLLFYCIWCVFSGGSRPFLGSLLDGHIFSFKSRNFFRGLRSHFLVQISELFFEGCVYIFSAILGIQTPPLDPPKKHDFGKVLRYGGPQKMFPWKRFSWIFVWLPVMSCNKKIVVCKFRRYDHHTHVLVATRKRSWQTRWVWKFGLRGLRGAVLIDKLACCSFAWGPSQSCVTELLSACVVCLWACVCLGCVCVSVLWCLCNNACCSGECCGSESKIKNRHPSDTWPWGCAGSLDELVLVVWTSISSVSRCS